MGKHTQTELIRMIDLVREYGENMGNNLDMPHGGSLSPDELAEMVLSQYVYKRHGLINEEAAAAVMAN